MGRFRVADWKGLNENQQSNILKTTWKAIYQREVTFEEFMKVREQLDQEQLGQGKCKGFCLLDGDKPAAFLMATVFPELKRSDMFSVVSPYAETNAAFHRMTGRTPAFELAVRWLRWSVENGCEEVYYTLPTGSGARFISRLTDDGLISAPNPYRKINNNKLPAPANLGELETSDIKGPEIEKLRSMMPAKTDAHSNRKNKN